MTDGMRTPARDGRKMKCISAAISIEDEILGTHLAVFDSGTHHRESRDQGGGGIASSPAAGRSAPPAVAAVVLSSPGVGGSEAPTAGRLVFTDGTNVPFVSSLFGSRRNASGPLVWASPPYAEDEVSNQEEMRGSIAVVWRGLPPGRTPGSVLCSFFDKAQRCRRAGAIGVVVVNNEDRSLAPTGNTHLDIPVVCLYKSHGESIKNGTGVLVEFEAQVWNEDHQQSTKDLSILGSSSRAHESSRDFTNKMQLVVEHNERVVQLCGELLGGEESVRAMALRAANREGIQDETAAKIGDKVLELVRENLLSVQDLLYQGRDAAKSARLVALRLFQDTDRKQLVDNVATKVESNLRKQLAEEKDKTRLLEEIVYREDVQETLVKVGASKPHRRTLLDKFEGNNSRAVFSVSLASDILGKARPSELGGAAEDMLQGKAGELAGTEGEHIIRLRQKTKKRVSAKWFCQWYDMVNWRALQKVLRSLLEDESGEGPGRLLHVETLLGSFNVELQHVQEENMKLHEEANRVKKEINEKVAHVLEMQELVDGWEAKAAMEAERERGLEMERAEARERYWEQVGSDKEEEKRQLLETFEKERESFREEVRNLQNKIEEHNKTQSTMEATIGRLQQRLLETERAKDEAQMLQSQAEKQVTASVRGKGSRVGSRVASRTASVEASRAASPGLSTRHSSALSPELRGYP